ncbi:DASH complex subunit Dad1-domain-containing protein [Leucosporidium creatinivorum]|uniref:DASH complex subunit DAD1 n=1 Tax=Leucosporidium creatinivorum TaxID=106004 RepID=A0A1Y2FZX8_9BASI|nr:DASH complex subunit Dad1-domain-containing protein [Leucosporidium creatinivorum]
MSYSDKTDFERERDRLIAEIAENLAKCCSSVNQLNRNIENVIEVGKGFDSVHDLWKQFETVMAGSTDSEAPRDPILQRELPEGTDETAILPPGIAPGGGSLPMLGVSTSGPAEGARE